MSLHLLTRRLIPVSTIASRGFRPYTSKTFSISELSDSTYHRLSESTLQHLTEYFENLGEKTDFPGYDIEYASGVLTLKVPVGTYVINKQPPNKQIWLSSPLSGPKRYDFDLAHACWFYHRDHTTLDELLNRELSDALKLKVDVFENFAPES
ncbi:uncharacterized protein VTP21DRAFT_2503 [Calcarisporiella thermophila]|uniref:uncharacterized protein n=1 Tax=Calcarisporiella thermophila TaxID=911321 RepID=UPI0037428564